MKSHVLHTVWCHISCEAAGEFWHWSLSGVKGLNNGNRTEWGPIWSVIIRVITKLDDRKAGVKFANHRYDYRQTSDYTKSHKQLNGSAMYIMYAMHATAISTAIFKYVRIHPKLASRPVWCEKMFLCCFFLKAGRKDLTNRPKVLSSTPPPP